MNELEPRGNGSAQKPETSKSLSYLSVQTDIGELFFSGVELVSEGIDYLRKRFELLRSSIYRGEGVPHGGGQKVIEIQGMGVLNFWLDDFSYFLAKSEYEQSYLLGSFQPNTFPVREMAGRLIEKASQEAQDGRKVIVIGHSKGGYDALAAVFLYPYESQKYIDRIVLLASPIAERVRIHPAAAFLHSATSGREDEELLREVQPDFNRFSLNGGLTLNGVKLISIWSDQDRIIQPTGRMVPRQYMIPTTHLGMIVDQKVYKFFANKVAERNPYRFHLVA